eukprot:9472919-Alexandrium_andersonii.AAC.1
MSGMTAEFARTWSSRTTFAASATTFCVVTAWRRARPSTSSSTAHARSGQSDGQHESQVRARSIPLLLLNASR